MLEIIYRNKFDKDVKNAKKREKNIKKLKNLIKILVEEKPLPYKNKNHKLKGNLKNYWECHIDPDWLIVYKKTVSEIIFIRTGSHSDLFK